MHVLAFLVFSTFASVYTYPCEDCICTKWQNTLTCYGRNVSHIPMFDINEWVSHVDLLNTSITDLSELLGFAHLYSIDIRDNAFLECDLVGDFMRERRDLLILTDCDDYDSDDVLDESANVPVYDWLNVITLPPIFVIIAILIAYIRRKRKSEDRQTYEPCLSNRELDVMP